MKRDGDNQGRGGDRPNSGETAADRQGAQSTARGRFTAHISDETFTFHPHTFDDRKVTGAQIAEAVRANPVTDYVILHWLPTFELESVRPTETVDVKDLTRFFIMKGDGTERFFVDGLSLEWPKKTITGKFIKRLVGKDDEDVELLLDREDQPDKVIEDEEEVRIGRDGVEKFKTRPAKGVTIVVNGDPHRWEKKKISYTEVVKLADPTYPQDPPFTYSVKYTKGPASRPEGDLVEGESTPVRDGMVFKVTPTGQS